MHNPSSSQDTSTPNSFPKEDDTITQQTPLRRKPEEPPSARNTHAHPRLVVHLGPNRPPQRKPASIPIRSPSAGWRALSIPGALAPCSPRGIAIDCIATLFRCSHYGIPHTDGSRTVFLVLASIVRTAMETRAMATLPRSNSSC